MSGVEVGQSWIEWGVRRTSGAVGTVAPMDRWTAERCAREWPAELVSRVVQTEPWRETATATNPAPTGEGETDERSAR